MEYLEWCEQAFHTFDDKYFGRFKCHCGKEWASAHSWARWDNKLWCWITRFEMCNECSGKVLPHDQAPLQYSGKKFEEKHYCEKCEKCIALGSNCKEQRVKRDQAFINSKKEQFYYYY